MPSVSKFQILVRVIWLAIFATWFAALVPLHAEFPESASPRSLEGAWWVNVSVFDCNTLAPKGKFTSLLLFSRGGAVTETTANPGFLPGQRSIGIGNWDRSRYETYTASDVAFILFSGGPFQAGTQKITHTITLSDDGSRWSDRALVDFYDATGAPIVTMHACATATAARLQ
ncbi:MAG: hypothetical protein WCA10_02790 [Terracidiphilus sp.]